MDIVELPAEPKAVPRLHGRQGDLRGRAVACPNPRFVQRAVVIRSETLEETVEPALAEVGTIGELMPVEVVDAGGNEYLPEDIERGRQALDEIVEKVVVGVSAVVKESPEGSLQIRKAH